MKGIVKEEKSRYAHDFLLGIGQLKDSLDTSRRRQLELEKEKKKLLLSLSHDIKTPLNTIQLYARALRSICIRMRHKMYTQLIRYRKRGRKLNIMSKKS